MDASYNPAIEYRVSVNQADSRVVQQRAGDINLGIHDEPIKGMFGFNLPTFLPGQVLSAIAIHRTLNYAREYLSESVRVGDLLAVEHIITDFGKGFEIRDGVTPEILARTFVDYTQPTIWANNRFMMVSDYDELVTASEQTPVQIKDLDKIVRCYSRVGLSTHLDSQKYEPGENSVEWGQLKASLQDDEYHATLDRVCGYEIDRQAQVPLYLTTNFANVFMDLLVHPERAGQYQEVFEAVQKRMNMFPVSAEELVGLLENDKDKALFANLASLYQFEDRLWIPRKSLPFYSGKQKVRVFDGIEQISSGKPCDVFVENVVAERKSFKLRLVGAVHNEGAYLWKAFESDINLGYLPIGKAGFRELASKITEARKIAMAAEKEES